MLDNHDCNPTAPRRTPWNKGKLIGAKPPLPPKHVDPHPIVSRGTNPRLGHVQFGHR